MSDDAERAVIRPTEPLTRDALRGWLDRSPPPGSWRDFEATTVDQRDWYEFNLARAADPQMEAGHG